MNVSSYNSLPFVSFQDSVPNIYLFIGFLLVAKKEFKEDEATEMQSVYNKCLK